MQQPICKYLRTDAVNAMIVNHDNVNPSHTFNGDVSHLIGYIKQLESLLEISFDLYPKEKLVIVKADNGTTQTQD